MHEVVRGEFKFDVTPTAEEAERMLGRAEFDTLDLEGGGVMDVIIVGFSPDRTVAYLERTVRQLP